MTLCLLKTKEEPRNIPEGEAELPQDVRFDKVNHFQRPTSQGRCKMCKKIPKPCVKKCNVRLHAQRGQLCFEVYHTKQ